MKSFLQTTFDTVKGNLFVEPSAPQTGNAMKFDELGM